MYRLSSARVRLYLPLIRLISISIVTTDRELQTDLLTYDVGPDMTLNDLKAFVQAETNVPPTAQIFLKDGRPVADNSMTLSQFGVQEGDLMALAISSNPPRRRPAEGNPGGEPSAQRTRNANGQEQLRLRILQERAVRAEVERQDPELAAAAEDSQRFHDLWDARRAQNEQLQREKEEQMARLEADPFNLEAQQKIEEMIRQERVAENMQKAMEEFPEGQSDLTK
jgi:DNA damage-inducible protein 1